LCIVKVDPPEQLEQMDVSKIDKNESENNSIQEDLSKINQTQITPQNSSSSISAVWKPSDILSYNGLEKLLSLTAALTFEIACPNKDLLKKFLDLVESKKEEIAKLGVDYDEARRRFTFSCSEREYEAYFCLKFYNLLLGNTEDINDQSLIAKRLRELFKCLPFPSKFSLSGKDDMTGLGSLCELSNESVNNAKKFIQQLLDVSDKVYLNTLNLKGVSLSSNTNPSNLVESLLANHDGFCVGEVHSDRAPKKWIIDNMAVLKSNGVKTLFLEHLHYDTMQKDLNDYFNAGNDIKMPEILVKCLREMDAGYRIHDGNFGFLQLVKEAKNQGIRVVAIDTSVSYLAGTSKKTGVNNRSERHRGMNALASYIIEKEKKEGKFIALMGSGHVGKVEGVPGVADILQCPSLIISSGAELKLQLNVTNFKNAVEHVGGVLSYPVNNESPKGI
jgi:hypothetical protein